MRIWTSICHFKQIISHAVFATFSFPLHCCASRELNHHVVSLMEANRSMFKLTVSTLPCLFIYLWYIVYEIFLFGFFIYIYPLLFSRFFIEYPLSSPAKKEISHYNMILAAITLTSWDLNAGIFPVLPFSVFCFLFPTSWIS